MDADQWEQADARLDKQQYFAMPTSGESRRHAASKKTRRSERARKRVGKNQSGMRKRRLKRMD